MKLLHCLFFLIFSSVIKSDFLPIDETKLAFDEIAKLKKYINILLPFSYPVSTYTVTTKDNYVLTLFRIHGPKGKKIEELPKDPNRKVVLLGHGLADSADSWIVAKENEALAFVLANKGYDVFVKNDRGNKYSRKHRSLNPEKDKTFWDYSLHEVATLDFPAVIEFIKNTTGAKRMTYVGHSQGTSVFFAGASLNPTLFANSFNGFVALGPVTYLDNIKVTGVDLAVKTHIGKIMDGLGIKEMFNHGKLYSLQNKLCEKFKTLCKGVLKLVSDLKTTFIDKDRLPHFVSHFPSGTSTRSLTHFLKIYKHKDFVDPSGQPYPLKNIKDIPIGLLVGSSDMLATPEDARRLKVVLETNKVLDFYKEYANIGHLAFFITTSQELRDDILKLIEKYSSRIIAEPQVSSKTIPSVKPPKKLK